MTIAVLPAGVVPPHQGDSKEARMQQQGHIHAPGGNGFKASRARANIFLSPGLIGAYSHHVMWRFDVTVLARSSI